MYIKHPDYIQRLSHLFFLLNDFDDEQLDCINYISKNILNKYPSKFKKYEDASSHEDVIEYFKYNSYIASNLLEELSDNNCIEASYYLGLCYDWAICVNQDIEKAFHFYLIAAKNYFHKAYNHVALCYQCGLGIERDINEAISWYNKASDIGDSIAQHSLYLIYSKGGSAYGDNNIKIDNNLADKYLLLSANNGYSYAQIQLAIIEEDKKNYVQSFHWFNKSAINGHEFAQFKIGYYYENGIGCEINMDKAIFWYTKSAEQGFGEAQNALSKLGR